MEVNQRTGPRILVYHARQCDPKKCTGLRLVRMHKSTIIKDMKRIPKGSVVLNPVSEIAFSPADSQYVNRSGLVALDCSWKLAENIFRNSRSGNQRALPYLIAANPVNTYIPVKLSTAEALAAALYIVGQKSTAIDLMSVFKWGPSFLILNQEWLDAYSECETSLDVVEVQKEIMESHQRESK